MGFFLSQDILGVSTWHMLVLDLEARSLYVLLVFPAEVVSCPGADLAPGELHRGANADRVARFGFMLSSTVLAVLVSAALAVLGVRAGRQKGPVRVHIVVLVEKMPHNGVEQHRIVYGVWHRIEYRAEYGIEWKRIA